MAFDSPTRGKLQRLVSACRKLLTDEFDDQLQSLYGIYAKDGRVLDLDTLRSLDDDQRAIGALLRERITHLQSGLATSKAPLADAVQRLLREQAFTILNRFAALRMAEERELVLQCVGDGLNSKGFQIFEQLASPDLGSQYERYRVFLDCLFDELSLDLGVLFDRFSPFGLLFPREPKLKDFFALLNDPELKSLWREDETIGWIYQYFNDEAERKKMREESAAPRNSRELAVRNQFFTPRYVVEFLTDNTLGRLWYEMTRGETVLRDRCRYLVRRPTEIFLKEGESAPESTAASGAEENPSQEDLLRAPVHIPHRPLKDPRSIRVLDPACGSMHFGLYAFDLFECIYDEAWEIAHGTDEALKSAPSFAPFVIYAAQFADKAAFLREVPRLIVEHNLHGIDIDPRAAQIAGLSLWLRAHRAWQRAGVKLADRPRITRSNLVCAEPMPGEKELLREFVEGAFPAGERPAFAFLLENIFDCMTLAGEAGSLLRIEEEIRTAIAEARALAQRQSTPRQAALFAGTEPPEQEEFNLRGLTTDEQFWEKAEERIYEALETYAEQAENGGGFQRRLFADDAAQGFAFIDLCRKRYDVVVMNPPFGASTDAIKDLLSRSYFSGRTDLYACFMLRAWELSAGAGAIGAITARTGFFLQSYSAWRTGLLRESKVTCFADLGGGVLDSAMVETAAYVLSKSTLGESPFIRLEVEEKGELLSAIIEKLSQGISDPFLFLRDPRVFAELPDQAWSYWIPQELAHVFAANQPFDPVFGDIRLGVQTNDDFRFSRLWWEVPCADIGANPEDALCGQGWISFLKGGDSSKYFAEVSMVLNWFGDGAEIKEAVTIALKGGHWSRHIQSVEYYFLPGVSWALRTDNFDPHLVPGGCISSISRYFAIPKQVSIWTLLAVWNCSLLDFLAKLRMEKWLQPKFVTGVVKDLPFPLLSQASERKLEESVSLIWTLKHRASMEDESSRYVVRPGLDPLLTLEGTGTQLSQTRNKELREMESLQEIIEREVLGSLDCRLESYGRKSKKIAAANGETDRLEEFGLSKQLGHDVLSYMVGCSFGRWDIRYATGERAAPELPDPFAPLPVCPPGMLQGDDGLPLSPEAGRQLHAADQYPLDVAWDGILVDDPEHSLDLERRVHAALQVLWPERADDLEHEACALLGVPGLREWFRRPTGFFADHLRRYSKSRRQAPIYWPLSTASGRYTLWLYYSRLTDQTLYRAVTDFVKPKLDAVTADVTRLQAKAQTATARERAEIEALSDFQTELQDLHDELLRVAQLPWKPNLNDGVLITASPLWKLFRLPKWQKPLEVCWKELSAGDYDWAHLAYSIWPDRVRAKCKTDRSLAIAHGLEDLCEVAAPKPKTKRGRKKMTMEEML